MELLEAMISLQSLGAGLLVALCNIARIIVVHNKNNIKESAETYVSNNDFKVVDKSEVYVRSYETKTKTSGK